MAINNDKVEITCPHCNKAFDVNLSVYLDLSEIKCTNCKDPVSLKDERVKPKFIRNK